MPQGVIMIKKYFTFSILFCLSVFVSAQSIEDKLLNRFSKYVNIYTQSEEDVDKVPSTDCQFDLAFALRDELISLGLDERNVRVDGHSYLYATIRGNVQDAPVLFLSAHLDTTPEKDLCGRVPTINVHDYQGGDLQINDKLILTPETDQTLAAGVGSKVITSDGTTLLGADDKAGIAIVMTVVETLLENPNIPHGDIRIIFTPDEEIGNSTRYLTRENIGADFGLVVDSHGFGRLLVGNFNATDFTFFVRGLSSGHSGYNSIPSPYRIGANFIANFPRERAAYNSRGMEGYIDHHKQIFTENTYTVKGRLRSFDLYGELKDYKDSVLQWASDVAQEAMEKYREKNEELKFITIINGEASGEYTDDDYVIILTMNDSYFNAKYVLEKYPTNFNLLQEAYNIAGVEMHPESGRGGSDAGDITYLGIPTYNLFDGSDNEHDYKEYVVLDGMAASYNVIVEYIQLLARQDRVTMLREGNPRYNPAIPNIEMKRIERIQQELLQNYGNTLINR